VALSRRQFAACLAVLLVMAAVALGYDFALFLGGKSLPADTSALMYGVLIWVIVGVFAKISTTMDGMTDADRETLQRQSWEESGLNPRLDSEHPRTSRHLHDI
jgi:predicted membrane metal-binding protein